MIELIANVRENSFFMLKVIDSISSINRLTLLMVFHEVI
jgi:hypothetical protein